MSNSVDAATSIDLIAYIIRLVVFIAVCAGVIYLQVLLSKKENKWVGNVLSLISICFRIAEENTNKYV